MTVLKLGTTIKEFFQNLNDNFSELSNKNKVLFSGSADVPSEGSTTIALSDDVTQYDGLIFYRDNMDGAICMSDLTVGTELCVSNRSATVEPVNICATCFTATITGTTAIRLSDNMYDYDFPLTKVVGVKL